MRQQTGDRFGDLARIFSGISPLKTSTPLGDHVTTSIGCGVFRRRTLDVENGTSGNETR